MNNKFISWFEFYTLIALLLFGFRVFSVYYTQNEFFYNKKGIKAFKKGDYEQAYENFQLAFENRNDTYKPKDTYRYINLGLCHDRLNDPEKAMYSYKRGVIRHPYRESGNDGKGSVFIGSIPKHTLPNFVAAFNLGELYGRQGKIDQALSQYQEAVNHPGYKMKTKKNIELLFLNHLKEKSLAGEENKEKEGSSENQNSSDSKGNEGQKSEDSSEPKDTEGETGDQTEEETEESSKSEDEATEAKKSGKQKKESSSEQAEQNEESKIEDQTGDQTETPYGEAEVKGSIGAPPLPPSKKTIDESNRSAIFEEIDRKESKIKQRLYRNKRPLREDKTDKDW